MLEKVLAITNPMGIWFQQLDEVMPYPWGYLFYMFIWGSGIALAGFLGIKFSKSREKKNKKKRK